jgi:hypothetical protein
MGNRAVPCYTVNLYLNVRLRGRWPMGWDLALHIYPHEVVGAKCSGTSPEIRVLKLTCDIVSRFTLFVIKVCEMVWDRLALCNVNWHSSILFSMRRRSSA